MTRRDGVCHSPVPSFPAAPEARRERRVSRPDVGPSCSGRVGLAGCRTAGTGRPPRARQNSRVPPPRAVSGDHHRHQHGQQRNRDPDDRLDIYSPGRRNRHGPAIVDTPAAGRNRRDRGSSAVRARQLGQGVSPVRCTAAVTPPSLDQNAVAERGTAPAARQIVCASRRRLVPTSARQQ